MKNPHKFTGASLRALDNKSLKPLDFFLLAAGALLLITLVTMALVVTSVTLQDVLHGREAFSTLRAYLGWGG